MYYFASDIHLGMNGALSSLEREKLLVRWLDEVSVDAKAIFLVGDVFDFWFEWKRVIPKGFTRLLGKLTELSDRGIKIHFFTGNHDMWAYSYLHDECGVTLHYRPEVFDLYGKKMFIAHGDNMYIRKRFGERIMQWLFHAKFVRRVLALLHPNVMVRFGQWGSERSRKLRSSAHVFCGEKEHLVQYARKYQEALGNSLKVDYFIFGHIHCAENYDMGDGRRALFLGEWLTNPTYAVMNPDGEIDLKSYK